MLRRGSVRSIVAVAGWVLAFLASAGVAAAQDVRRGVAGVAVTKYDAKWPSVAAADGPVDLRWAGDGAVPRARFAAELEALQALPPADAIARARALSEYAAVR